MEENRQITVLCYGDSNTYGYDPHGGRYSADVRWPKRLAKLLGEEYEVISEGLNGRTTTYDREDGIFKNGLPYLTPCLLTHMPIDWLIFMLGTNDCNAELHLSTEDIARGMDKLLNVSRLVCLETQGFVPKTVLVVPAAILPDVEGTPFEDQLDEAAIRKSREIAPYYAALAEKYGCIFLDGTDELEVSAVDCEHLTEAGHARLAQLLCEIIGN